MKAKKTLIFTEIGPQLVFLSELQMVFDEKYKFLEDVTRYLHSKGYVVRPYGCALEQGLAKSKPLYLISVKKELENLDSKLFNKLEYILLDAISLNPDEVRTVVEKQLPYLNFCDEAELRKFAEKLDPANMLLNATCSESD